MQQVAAPNLRDLIRLKFERLYSFDLSGGGTAFIWCSGVIKDVSDGKSRKWRICSTERASKCYDDKEAAEVRWDPITEANEAAITTIEKYDH